ncbi:MAG TPA: hypothetical protein VFY23_00450 [Candidatus Limnocylindrales bacterium]|nr:hypothetical protein [Candidatus Limnocylindrales bacterium]
MLASNPVDPSQRLSISYHKEHGPASVWPRHDEQRGLGNGIALFGAAALLAIGYVVGGLAAASAAPAAPVTGDPQPVEQDGGIGGPAAKQGGTPVGTAVPGEFRLGPGNNQPPGIREERPEVAPRLAVPGAVPGEFRLGPGNNAAPGLVPAVATGGTDLPHDLHAAATATMSPDAILPFK